MKKAIGIVLAAGEGTRMVSTLPKPLHKVAGKSMLGHVLTAIQDANLDQIAVVVSKKSSLLQEEAERWVKESRVFVQEKQLGTAHAVLAARTFIEENPATDIIIAFVDNPLISTQTILQMMGSLKQGYALSVLGFQAQNPFGYGRLLVEDKELVDIREHKEATEDERKISLCNAGFMALKGETALKILEKIDDQNAKGEYYLTDAVKVARNMGYRATFIEAEETEVHGVNDRIQLAEAEALMQQRLRRAAMLQGVTMIDPPSVFLAFDTQIGHDVIIEPHVTIGEKVVLSDNVTVHSFCHLESTHLAQNVHVGPFARLRSQTVVGEGAKVGNFVEIKNSKLEKGVKAGHLAYLGDAIIGAKTNIGAGTITCNYDGWGKYKTVIGEGAFIGSNSSLVAPVTIGAGAYIGSGSTITDDVPEDALALGRGRQIIKENWAENFRMNKMLEKK